MPEANQHLQTSVQRLRIRESANLIPGSQLSAPRTLRPERPPGLNMPHPKRPVVLGTTYGLAAAAMGQGAAVKRWHTAQTAASRKWGRPRPNRLDTLTLRRPRKGASKGGQLALLPMLRGFAKAKYLSMRVECVAGVQGNGLRPISTRRAYAHHTTTTLLDGRKGRGLAGTDPSTFLSPRKRGGMR